MGIETWAILRAAEVSDEEAPDVLLRAQRIAARQTPDGKYEYVPKTAGWADWIAAGMRPNGPLSLRNLEG